MAHPSCKRHRAKAGWRCQGCRALLCPDCVATKRVQVVTDLDVCLECGELAEPLTRHRREESSFTARLPGALIWPLSKAGLVSLGGIALLRALVSYLGTFGWAFGACVLAAVCFTFIRSTARGSNDFESLDYGDFFNDLFLPGIKALVAASLVWVPVVYWLATRHSNAIANPTAVLSDPVVWLLLVGGVLYAPMAILVGASGGSLVGMLNPLHVVRNALRLGPNYFVTVVVLCVLFVPWFISLGIGSMLNVLPLPFVPRVLDYAVSCYVPFVAARVLGLLLFTHGDEVGYGMESDYRVALLPGVAPRGVVPEVQVAEAPKRNRHAPIELEPEPEPRPEPVAEGRVERLKELDPDALPPLKVE